MWIDSDVGVTAISQQAELSDRRELVSSSNTAKVLPHSKVLTIVFYKMDWKHID